MQGSESQASRVPAVDGGQRQAERQAGLPRAPRGARVGALCLDSGRWGKATCGCEVGRSRWPRAEHQRAVRGGWGGTEPRAEFAPRSTGHPVASEFRVNVQTLEISVSQHRGTHLP